ncbi:Oidioi.mRNA.OKI2018_I69.PAR.g11992.t1.cds [Oikopleura dioica]|uniref:Oidioi.mRNA.OKI2018_I69.PAR.g11992.t1.cds n=1 Tax=Oikopleura dioica TaxID=34765 RepID=A0ABN7S1U5_OIKDI|nr:Oidioi.mRNA.OKI2018_I69.PAR.g11992.t1.cds [Oikopleura dioica]
MEMRLEKQCAKMQQELNFYQKTLATIKEEKKEAFFRSASKVGLEGIQRLAKCAVCYQEYIDAVKPVSLPCGHVICKDCAATIFDTIIYMLKNTPMRIGIFCYLIRLISPLVNYGIIGILFFILISCLLLFIFLPSFDKKKKNKPTAQQMYTALEAIAKELHSAQDMDSDDLSPSEESL